MRYHPQAQVWRWKFRDFFDSERFITALGELSAWIDFPVRDLDLAQTVHQEFLRRHQYRHTQTRCNIVLQAWQQGQDLDLSYLQLLEQAWIESQIEQETGRDLHRDCVEFWHTLGEIRTYVA